MSDLSEKESVNGEIEFLEDYGNAKRKGQYKGKSLNWIVYVKTAHKKHG